MRFFSIVAVLASFFLSSCSMTNRLLPATSADTSKTPMHDISKPGVVTNWFIAGPFPNAAFEKPEVNKPMRAGFDTDYLTSLGGEANAEFTTTTQFAEADINAIKRKPEVRMAFAGEQGKVDLIKHLAKLGFKDTETTGTLIYALAYIDSPIEQDAHFLFGSDDWAKVWVNGKQVHSIWKGIVRSHTLQARDDHFTAHLRQGTNTVLVKVENYHQEFGFVFEPMTAANYAKYEKEKKAADYSERLRNLRIKPESDYDHIILPGPFPKIIWSDSILAAELFGSNEPKVRWFDSKLNEVDYSVDPGRYGVYAEAKTKDGRTIRRATTFYVRDWAWEPWNTRAEVHVPEGMLPQCEPGALAPYKEMIDGWASNAVNDSLFRDDMGPIMCAAFRNAKPLGHPPDAVRFAGDPEPGIPDGRAEQGAGRIA